VSIWDCRLQLIDPCARSCDGLLKLPASRAGIAPLGGNVAGPMTRRSAVVIAVTALATSFSGVLLDSGPAAARTPPAVGHSGALGQALERLRSPLGDTATHAPSHPSALTSTSSAGGFGGVAAISSTRAWAVGSTSAGVTVIKQWNGTAWKKVDSPTPSGGADLRGVAVVSRSHAWAVGYTGGRTPEPFILAWNGKAWSHVKTRSVGGGGLLQAVTAISAADAWAVGYTTAGATLILHWNGSTWVRVPSPTPADTKSALYGVAATSIDSVWAVGGSGDSTLILYWDGANWTQYPSPTPAGAGTLRSVSGTTSGLWAVGYSAGNPGQPLILDMGPSGWEQEQSPVLSHGGGLNSVVATSTGGAWAAGFVMNSKDVSNTLTLRLGCCGWSKVATPSPGSSSALSGIASFGSKAWAVGVVGTTSNSTLTENWNGTDWKTMVATLPSVPDLQSASVPPQYSARALRRPSQSRTVTVWGPVNCAGIDPAMSLYYKSNFVTTRVRFQTASGYAADATVVLGSTYTVQLTGVPPGGETATAYISCDVPNNPNPVWGCQFQVMPSQTGLQYLWLAWHWMAGSYDPPGC
jgi:hypothetical protein